MSNVVIDGVEYAPTNQYSDTKIVVADRGWVFIGRVQDPHKYGNGICLSSAHVIRRWGTDVKRPGLGWLALHGATENTILEPSGIVFVPTGSVVAVFDVVSEWEL